MFRFAGEFAVTRLFFEAFRWIFGLAGLLTVDLFAEFCVFEWLQWNGTDKNDWFFILWWGVVLLWTLSCGQRCWRTIRVSDDTSQTVAESSSHQN